MIAPLGEPGARSGASASPLATARRALAATMFKPRRGLESRATRVSKVRAWLFVVWAVAVAVSYFALAPWWSIPSY